MPANDSNRAALQAPGYYALVYMSVMTGTEQLNATVSSTPTYPALNLAITVNSGAAANVKAGMRIVVRSAAGAYKGTLIVRSTGTISAANIPTREFGAGMANVVSGDVLHVYDDFPPADKLVADVGEPPADAFAPDRASYVDQNNPAPVPTSGGNDARWLADAAAIPFTGSSSYSLAGAFVTHAWSASGGSLSSPTDSDVTFAPGAAGKYRITHTVTDTGNSKMRTQYTRVRVHDANDPPYEVMLTQPPTCDVDSGWRCRIRLFAGADLDSLPDYAPVILWVGTGAVAFGCATPGRHHILMDGYLRRDEQSINPTLNTIEFDVISPLAALAELPGFSKVMLREASPNEWAEISDLTVKRAIVQLPLFYTTLIEGGRDFVFNGFNDADYSALFVQKDNPLAQMRELALARVGRVVCHKNGRFEVQGLLEVEAISNRSLLTTTYTIAPDDVDAGDGTDGIQMTREHKRTVETFRARGFTEGAAATDNNAVFARWDSAPMLGNQSTTQERLIVDDTAQLYEWTGMLGAAVNRDYQVDGDALYHAPEARVPLRGAYWAIFDFFREWIAFSGYTASSNLRGIDLTAFRWQFRGLALEWDETGFPRTGLELAAETAGVPGVDDTPAQTDIDPGTDPGDVIPPLGATPTINSLKAGVAQIAAVNNDGYVYLFADWQTTPVVTRYSLTALGLTGSPETFIVDADSPLYTGTGTTVNGWIGTINGVYRITNLGNIGGTAALSALAPLTLGDGGFSMAFERGTANLGYYANYNRGDGVRVYETTDGLAWSLVLYDTNNDANGGAHHNPGAALSPHTGRFITSVFTNTASGGSITARGQVTTDGGTSFGNVANPNIDSTGNGLAFEIHVPFADDSIAYYNVPTNPYTYDMHLYKVVGAGTPVDVSPTDGGDTYGPLYPFGIKTCDIDPNTALLVGVNDGGSTWQWGVWLSRNAGATWTTLIAPGDGFTTNKYRAGNIAGDNPSALFVWGESGNIAFSLDGATLLDKRGNIPVDYAGAGRFINIAGV